jgi:four helix bundle protein
MMPFERLEVWHDAHAFALAVNAAADKWPTREMFVLTAQARRAAISIPNNISEGVAKKGPKEFRRFLDIALGSFSELTYLLLFARDRGYLTREQWQTLDDQRAKRGRRLWALYKGVARMADAT